MAGQTNAAPVIIKRKKIIQGGGHHGGAWKVAYADFVTAMMAFFMLMWLLNATTEKQRKGIADYFNPTIPVNRISGGGDGAFGGDSVFSEETLAQTGTGASLSRPTDDQQARGENLVNKDGMPRQGEGSDEVIEEVEKALIARGGESMTMERLLRHVVTRVTDEGLVIEIFDLDDATLFAGRHRRTRTCPASDRGAAGRSPEPGDQRGRRQRPRAQLSDHADRQSGLGPVGRPRAADAQELETAGLGLRRSERVAGFADRKPGDRRPDRPAQQPAGGHPAAV